MNPEGFREYVRTCKAAGKSPNVKIARFASRYKMARQIKGITLDGYSQTTSEIYATSLRISLGFSALECLESLMKPTPLSIKSEALAEKLRADQFSKLKRFLIQESDTSLKNQLQNAFNSKRNIDLLPAIRAIRHVTFHGQFTPTGAGLTTKGALIFLCQIEELLFLEINKLSATYFESLGQ